MPRLVHKATGVTVSVDDEAAKVLGGDYEPEKREEPPRNSGRSSTKK